MEAVTDLHNLECRPYNPRLTLTLAALFAPSKPPSATPTTHFRKWEKVSQQWLYDAAIARGDNNAVLRQLQPTHIHLYHFDTPPRAHPPITLPHGWVRRCYGCSTITNTFDANYVFSCVRCGALFAKHRMFQRNLHNHVAVVIGARTKLGHQIVRKLLEAGATVVGTTRYPDKMRALFDGYPSFLTDRLVLYDAPLDLDSPTLVDTLTPLMEFLSEQFGRVDILVLCAAQTIRARDKPDGEVEGSRNKYGDSKFVDAATTNSWMMRLEDLRQPEMEEILRVNAMAPTLLVQQLLPLLKESLYHPTILNVHAREGLISVKKSPNHLHTNFGKTCLHMLTKCLIAHHFRSSKGKRFRIHGCCPGFLSVDEYFEGERPWLVPPIDEVDGAARVLYPLFAELASRPETRRHFHQLLY